MTGRKPLSAQRNRVTIQEIIELTGVSYSAIYQRLTSGQIPSAEQDSSGTWTIARKDVRLIRRRDPKYPDGRKPFYVRVDLERAAAWEKAAGDQGVTAWLTKLGDLVSGYKPGDPET